MWYGMDARYPSRTNGREYRDFNSGELFTDSNELAARIN